MLSSDNGQGLGVVVGCPSPSRVLQQGSRHCFKSLPVQFVHVSVCMRACVCECVSACVHIRMEAVPGAV